MTHAKRKFTTAAEVRAIKLIESGSPVLWTDAAHPYLKLHVQRRQRVWRFVKRISGRDFDETLGNYPALSLAEARAAANEHLLAIQRGEYQPRSAGLRYTDITLQQGFELYKAERNLRPSTEKTYNSVWNHHCTEIKDRRMVELANEPLAVKKWHDKLPANIARLAYVLVQGIYSTAQVQFDHMPPAPIRKLRKPPTRRVSRDFSTDRLSAHHAAVKAMSNATRRALADFLYLSGQRMEPIRTMRWAWARSDRIIFPSEVMKGGDVFELPLTAELTSLLQGQRGKSEVYVFPGRGPDAPITHLKLRNSELMNQQEMRSHWATVAHGVVPYAHAEMLMDHRISGVAAHYIQPTFSDLAESMASVTLHLGIRKTTNGTKNGNIECERPTTDNQASRSLARTPPQDG